MSKVFIERAAPLTKEGIRAVCGTDEEYSEYVKDRKDHNEFLKDVEVESSLPAQTCRALSPESEEDIAMYADVEKLKTTESMSAGDALEKKDEGDKNE